MLCKEGYSGPLCAVCEAEEGYIKQVRKCVKCDPASWGTVFGLLFAVACLIAGGAFMMRKYVRVFERGE
jgi:hypothetical protein